MRLLMTPTSPYARKVRMFAYEKGMPLAEVVEPPHAPGSRVPQLNPLAKVPTLLRADGTAVFDSRVIVQYLDLLQPEPVLIPHDLEARIAVLRWEALADGVADATVLWMMEARRPPERQDPAWSARQLTKIEGGLQECQRALDGRAYFVGNSLTLADLAVVAAAGYVVLRGAVDLEQDRFQPLRAWLAVMHQRPGVAATVPPA